MKTNLLLLDTLKNMENLIHSGFSLSSQLERKLKIVYVLEFAWLGRDEFVGSTAPDIDVSVRVAEQEIRKDFENAEIEMRQIAAKHLETNLQNIPYEIEVVESSRLQIVEETIEKEKDVLLLMSNYNTYSGLETGTINYPNVIDKVECPVLIVPDNISSVSINNYLYATALHAEDLKALSHLSGLIGGANGKKLTVFHNMETTDFESILKWRGFKDMVKDSVDGFQLSFAHSNEKSVRDALKKYLEDNTPDLLVVLKEKKGFFEDLFSSSETHYIVTHFNKPILIYHEENLK